MKKILWSVDAFQEDANIQKQSIALLGFLARKTGCAVEPVYVLSPDQVNVTVEFTPPWVDQYLPAAEKALRHSLKEVDIPGLTQPKVIVQNIPSVSRAVQALSNYATATSADVIAVGTHGRHGLPRLIIGSFTESLLLSSRVPILAISPGSRTPDRCEHILFPTDFSEASRSVFGKVVALARDLGARITLFHHLQSPIEPILQSGVYLLGGGWISTASYLDEASSSQRKQADAMVAAAGPDVRIDVRIESGPKGITQTTLELAEQEKIDLIAMASQSGPVAAALIGSVTRQLVRVAPCPVWVLHASGAGK
ncbi:MAG: universal stress protein [Oligoflexia bacterium]|nr:universal stress protein [Oligoflexia bacterium]